jgi:hypothetical protein
MKAMSRLGRAALVLAVGLSLVVTAQGTANAGVREPVEASGSRGATRAKTAAIAADCPQPGQRVTVTGSPNIYLVDPDNYLYLIPNESTYFSLWDSWDGVTVNDRLADCYQYYYSMDNAHLAGLAGTPNVYVWDAPVDAYRLITTADVFNKYGFSWGKIVSQDAVAPISDVWPWDY